MKHYWIILSVIESNETYMCRLCGLVEELPLETVCSGPRYKSSNNRPEPDEKILRQLGHGLK